MHRCALQQYTDINNNLNRSKNGNYTENYENTELLKHDNIAKHKQICLTRIGFPAIHTTCDWHPAHFLATNY